MEDSKVTAVHDISLDLRWPKTSHSCPNIVILEFILG